MHSTHPDKRGKSMVDDRLPSRIAKRKRSDDTYRVLWEDEDRCVNYSIVPVNGCAEAANMTADLMCVGRCALNCDPRRIHPLQGSFYPTFGSGCLVALGERLFSTSRVRLGPYRNDTGHAEAPYVSQMCGP